MITMNEKSTPYYGVCQSCDAYALINDDELCTQCAELQEELAAENAAEEAATSEPPITMDEMYQKAWREHQDTHRR